MAEIIKPTKIIRMVEYSRKFVWRNDHQSGFSFDCDEHGNILTKDFQEPALKNLDKCLKGEYDVIDCGIVRYEYGQIEPSVLRCDCGAELVLYDPFLETCEKCGADYNGCGQRLAPRSQWGEETGESLSDILSYNNPREDEW